MAERQLLERVLSFMKREEILIQEQLDYILNIPLTSDLQEKTTGIYGTPYNNNKVYIDQNKGALYVDNVVSSATQRFFSVLWDLTDTGYVTKLQNATVIGLSFDVYPTQVGNTSVQSNMVAYPVKFGSTTADYRQSLGIRDIVSNPTGANTVTKNQWNTMYFEWNLNTGQLYTSNGAYSGNSTRPFSKQGTNSTQFGLFIHLDNSGGESDYKGWVKNVKVWKIE